MSMNLFSENIKSTNMNDINQIVNLHSFDQTPEGFQDFIGWFDKFSQDQSKRMERSKNWKDILDFASVHFDLEEGLLSSVLGRFVLLNEIPMEKRHSTLLVGDKGQKVWNILQKVNNWMRDFGYLSFQYDNEFVFAYNLIKNNHHVFNHLSKVLSDKIKQRHIEEAKANTVLIKKNAGKTA